MKTIDTHFEEDPSSLIKLLKAAYTGESILYFGMECSVHCEPMLTKEEIKNVSRQSFNCCVNSANKVNNNLEFERGIFHYKKYKLNFYDANYEMAILFKDHSSKKITMNIQGNTFTKFLAAKIDEMPEDEKKTWLETNADSFDEGNKCNIL